MSTYERIQVGRKTVILRDPRIIMFLGNLALTGIEVDREGNEVGRKADRQHIIGLDQVGRRTRLKWDNHYGCLVSDTSTH